MLGANLTVSDLQRRYRLGYSTAAQLKADLAELQAYLVGSATDSTQRSERLDSERSDQENPQAHLRGLDVSPQFDDAAILRHVEDVARREFANFYRSELLSFGDGCHSAYGNILGQIGAMRKGYAPKQIPFEDRATVEQAKEELLGAVSRYGQLERALNQRQTRADYLKTVDQVNDQSIVVDKLIDALIASVRAHAPQPSATVEQVIRDAFVAGFKCAVGYGDNHVHFDGEQKERRLAAYLQQVRSHAHQGWEEIRDAAVMWLDYVHGRNGLKGADVGKAIQAVEKIIALVKVPSPPVGGREK